MGSGKKLLSAAPSQKWSEVIDNRSETSPATGFMIWLIRFGFIVAVCAAIASANS